MIEQTKQQRRPHVYAASRQTSLLNEVGLGIPQSNKALRTVIDKSGLTACQFDSQDKTREDGDRLVDPERSPDATTSFVMFFLLWIALPAWILDQLFWVLGL